MQVRLAAVAALGDCGASALPALVELLQDQDEELGGAVLAALSRSTQAHAQQALIEALHSPICRRRIEAARALARSVSHEAVEALREAALGIDDQIAAEAIASLSQLSHADTASALIQIAAWPARRERCIAALAALADAAVPALAQGLRESELDQRRAIVEALSRIGSPAAAEYLEFAQHDSHAAVRHAALASLAHIRTAPRTGLSAPAREGRN